MQRRSATCHSRRWEGPCQARQGLWVREEADYLGTAVVFLVQPSPAVATSSPTLTWRTHIPWEGNEIAHDLRFGAGWR